MDNISIVTDQKNLHNVEILNEFTMDNMAFISFIHIHKTKKFLAMALLNQSDIIRYIQQEITHLDLILPMEHDPFEIINLDKFLPQLSDFSNFEQINNQVNSIKDIELLKLKQCIIYDNLIALGCEIYYMGVVTFSIMLFSVKDNKIVNFINVVENCKNN